MKKGIIFTILVFTAAISMTSCSKQVDQKATTVPATSNVAVPQSFSSMQVPAGFTWSTINKVSFNFNGKAGEVFSSVLKVVNTDGTVIFQKLQNAGDNYSGTIEVPFNSENVTVQFGDNSQSFNCKSGNITMTFN